MFTGIVEASGIVQDLKRVKAGIRLGIEAPRRIVSSLKKGSSLAVSGVCLTLTAKKGKQVFFDAIRETLRRTTLGLLKKGDRVNLEQPLKAGARIEGHFVQGHVDGVGVVRRVARKGTQKSLEIAYPAAVRKTVVEKGSIAVDGVSLTIGKVSKKTFWVHCIPHTLRATTLGSLAAGSRVNLEADILLKFFRTL